MFTNRKMTPAVRLRNSRLSCRHFVDNDYQYHSNRLLITGIITMLNYATNGDSQELQLQACSSGKCFKRRCIKELDSTLPLGIR
jgi:hypothetical protein